MEILSARTCKNIKITSVAVVLIVMLVFCSCTHSGNDNAVTPQIPENTITPQEPVDTVTPQIIENTVTPFEEQRGEAVVFTDPEFEKCIRRILKSDDVIYAGDLCKIQSLDLCGASITSLEDLKWFPELTVLDVSWNYISDIRPVENLTKLEKLYMGYNSINDLSPLSKIKNLTELGLEYNNISDINVVTYMENLVSLNLEGNYIGDYTPAVNVKIIYK